MMYMSMFAEVGLLMRCDLGNCAYYLSVKGVAAVVFDKSTAVVDDITSVFSFLVCWSLSKNRVYTVLHVATPLTRFVSRFVSLGP